MDARRPFGTTGLEVSPLCLGGNVFGWSADRDASFAVLDAYVDAGGNFIDTAEVYSGWVPGNEGGESEAIIGDWLAGDRGVDLVVATKVGYPGGRYDQSLSRDRILRSCEESLKRLKMERIPLYYAHIDDPETPLEETLGAFGELIDQGLVGAIASSNYSADRLRQALEVSEERGLPRFGAHQPHYNLLDRDGYEGDLEDLCRERGLGVAVYFALARGFLTGKYRPGDALPDTPRAAGVTRDYLNERGFGMLEVLDAVAAAHDASPAQVALAWLMQRPGITAAVASATSPAQLAEILPAAEIELTDDEYARLDAAGAA
jgi:aryl-alcohol dehydrogenase-like predicted oxidoreductase